jgi:5-methylcytosine-specific restriction endonuclease McrA
VPVGYRFDPASGQRTCSLCGETKPLEGGFYPRKKTKRDPSGWRCRCIDCEKVLGRICAQEWKERYPEKYAAQLEKAKLEMPAVRQTSEYREWNNAYKKEYNKRPEAREVLRDRWRIKNALLKVEEFSPEGVIQRAITLEGKFTRADWLALIDAFDKSCAYCGEETKLTLEHLTPLSRGGKTEVGNIVPACSPCNSSKRARTVEEFLPERAAEIRQRATVH